MYTPNLQVDLIHRVQKLLRTCLWFLIQILCCHWSTIRALQQLKALVDVSKRRAAALPIMSSSSALSTSTTAVSHVRAPLSLTNSLSSSSSSSSTTSSYDIHSSSSSSTSSSACISTSASESVARKQTTISFAKTKKEIIMGTCITCQFQLTRQLVVQYRKSMDTPVQLYPLKGYINVNVCLTCSNDTFTL